jgi:hypothetical protein
LCRRAIEPLLNEDDLPQNSDVVLGLSQYAAAMTQFRSTYYRWHGHEDAWTVEDGIMGDSDSEGDDVSELDSDKAEDRD